MGINDSYCWICHLTGQGMTCKLCPRLFHLACLKIDSEPSGSWICPECDASMLAECVETRADAMQDVSINELCFVLKEIIDKMKAHPLSDLFRKPVDLKEFPDYNKYVVNKMDLSTLEKNVEKHYYGSAESFLSDARWIFHNCAVFNDLDSEVTEVSKNILKICEQEITYFLACPDCTLHRIKGAVDRSLSKSERATIEKDWFVQVCRSNPHPLVWAKLKGYPYWPAKVIREENGLVDVRFFGAHDRAWIPSSGIYMLSQQCPGPVKTYRSTFDCSLEELKKHIILLKKSIGFRFYPFKTPFKMVDILNNNNDDNDKKITENNPNNLSMNNNNNTGSEKDMDNSNDEIMNISKEETTALTGGSSKSRRRSRNKMIIFNKPRASKRRKLKGESSQTDHSTISTDQGERDSIDEKASIPDVDTPSRPGSSASLPFVYTGEEENVYTDTAKKSIKPPPLSNHLKVTDELLEKDSHHEKGITKINQSKNENSNSVIDSLCNENRLSVDMSTDTQSLDNKEIAFHNLPHDVENVDEIVCDVMEFLLEEIGGPYEANFDGDEEIVGTAVTDPIGDQDHLIVNTDFDESQEMENSMRKKRHRSGDSDDQISAHNIISRESDDTQTKEMREKIAASSLVNKTNSEDSTVDKENYVMALELTSRSSSNEKLKQMENSTIRNSAQSSSNIPISLSLTILPSSQTSYSSSNVMKYLSGVKNDVDSSMTSMISSLSTKPSSDLLITSGSLKADENEVSHSSSVQDAPSAPDIPVVTTSSRRSFRTNRRPRHVDEDMIPIDDVALDELLPSPTKRSRKTPRGAASLLLSSSGSTLPQAGRSTSRHHSHVNLFHVEAKIGRALLKELHGKLQVPDSSSFTNSTNSVDDSSVMVELTDGRILQGTDTLLEAFRSEKPKQRTNSSSKKEHSLVTPCNRDTCKLTPENIARAMKQLVGTNEELSSSGTLLHTRDKLIKDCSNSFINTLQTQLSSTLSMMCDELSLGILTAALNANQKSTLSDDKSPSPSDNLQISSDVYTNQPEKVVSKMIEPSVKCTECTIKDQKICRMQFEHEEGLKNIQNTLSSSVESIQKNFNSRLKAALEEQKCKLEEEKNKAVRDAKSKQWCSNCGKEALFYCCWNTGYCDTKCQLDHWPKHIGSCTRSQMTRDAGEASAATQSDDSGGSSSRSVSQRTSFTKTSGNHHRPPPQPLITSLSPPRTKEILISNIPNPNKQQTKNSNVVYPGFRSISNGGNTTNPSFSTILPPPPAYRQHSAPVSTLSSSVPLSLSQNPSMSSSFGLLPASGTLMSGATVVNISSATANQMKKVQLAGATGVTSHVIGNAGGVGGATTTAQVANEAGASSLSRIPVISSVVTSPQQTINTNKRPSPLIQTFPMTTTSHLIRMTIPYGGGPPIFPQRR